jgi:hypothetical protein
MAFAAMAGPMISGIASIAGASASANAGKKQGDAEEKISAWNAARYREEAAWAQSKGALDAAEREKQGRRKASEARAAMAQGGAAIDTGTPLMMEQTFASETAWRSDVEMANATKTQRDFENKASITLYEGKIRADASRTQAKASLLSGIAGGASSMIKGIGGAAGGGGGMSFGGGFG